MKNSKIDIINRFCLVIVSLIVVILIFLPIAYNKNGMILGQKLDFNAINNSQNSPKIPEIFYQAYPTLDKFTIKNQIIYCYDKDNNLLGKIVETANFAPNIFGHNGKTPLLVIISNDNIIQSVIADKNSEDKQFFSQVEQRGLLDSWNNLSIDEAKNRRVDTVTGATYSSKAIIDNMKLTLENIQLDDKINSNIVKSQKTDNIFQKFINSQNLFSWQNILVFLVLINGIFVATIFDKVKILRKIQLLATLIVLGLISGNFISLNLMTTIITRGAIFSINFILGLIILVSLIIPIVTGKRFYCFYLCPLGAFQELLGGCSKKKFMIPLKLVKLLNYLPAMILLILIFLWSMNLGLQLAGYELFSALLISSATLPFLSALAIVGIISIFINRPYCRFLCPSGFIIKYVESIHTNIKGNKS